MKIDAVLARHPWPWHITYHKCNASLWTVRNNNYEPVLWHHAVSDELRDAILELVEAHVAAAGRSSKEGKQ